MKETFNLLRKNGKSVGFATLLVILPLVFSSSIIYLVLEQEQVLKNLLLLQWSFLFFISIFTMALALTPTTLIAFIGGYFLNWNSLFFIVPAYLLASVVGYFLAKLLDSGKFVNSLIHHTSATKILGNLKKDELQIVILAKLSPVLPFAITNVLLAIGGASLKKFVFGAFIGMLPRTIVVVYAGINAQKLSELISNPLDHWGQLSLFILIFISIIGFGKIIFKSIK